LNYKEIINEIRHDTNFKDGNPYQKNEIFKQIWEEAKLSFPNYSKTVLDYNMIGGDVKSYINGEFYDSENKRVIKNMCS